VAYYNALAAEAINFGMCIIAYSAFMFIGHTDGQLRKPMVGKWNMGRHHAKHTISKPITSNLLIQVLIFAYRVPPLANDG